MAARQRTALGVHRHLPGLRGPDVYKCVLRHSTVGFSSDIWTTQHIAAKLAQITSGETIYVARVQASTNVDGLLLVAC
jgi:hypothetical protein